MAKHFSHSSLVTDLLYAVTLPLKRAIVKTKGHRWVSKTPPNAG